MDLTRHPDCYTNKLAPKLDIIKQMFYDEKVSFEEMREFVKDLVVQAKNTKARQRFLKDYLYEECWTKRDIEQLCFNAVQKSRRFKG